MRGSEGLREFSCFLLNMEGKFSVEFDVFIETESSL